MPVKEIEFSHMGTSPFHTFNETIKLNGATNIINVEEVRGNDVKLEHEFDKEKEELSIKFSVQSNNSSPRTVTGYLYEEIPRGEGFYSCFYRHPDGEYSLGLVSCPPTYEWQIDYFNFSYRIKIEYETKFMQGTVTIQTQNDKLMLPVYDADTLENNQLRTVINGEVVCFELVEHDDSLASPLRIMTSNGIKAISKEE